MVAFLSTSGASAGFDQIVDFLNAYTIHYALVINPTIYVSCIKQFWAMAVIKKVNDVVQLRALIDGKKVVVSEDVIRRDLHLDDPDGVECLANEEIFEKLSHMCYEKPPPKLTFYKAFFSAQWKVSTAQRVESSTDTVVGSEGCIQTGGKIEAIDADEDITLVDVEKDKKDVSVAEPTVFDDKEVTMTMAQTLIKLKVEKAKLLNEHIAQKLHDEEVKKAAARDKQEKDDLERAQNMAGYKMEHFRGMTYDKVRPIFEREYKKVQTLFKPDKDVEEPKKKRVAEKTLLQESFKKLRVVEVSGSESTQEIPSNDLKEMSEEDV
nr:hypothetical protein [Tanacetum cinerariifolium]